MFFEVVILNGDLVVLEKVVNKLLVKGFMILVELSYLLVKFGKVGVRVDIKLDYC